MKRFSGFLALLALTVAGAAAAQDDFTPATYQAYGDAQVGEYTMLDGYEPGVNDADYLGSLLVTTASPGDQAIDVVILGPNNYENVIEVQQEQLVENLEPGTYVIAATDDGLQMVSTKVDLAVGRVASVTLTLTETSAATAEDMTTAIGDYQPYGEATVGDYQAAEVQDRGILVVQIDAAAFSDVTREGYVVGPDDYRQDIDASEAVIELNDLQPGAYLVAISGEGADLTETVVEVRAGEIANATFTLSAMESMQQ